MAPQICSLSWVGGVKGVKAAQGVKGLAYVQGVKADQVRGMYLVPSTWYQIHTPYLVGLYALHIGQALYSLGGLYAFHTPHPTQRTNLWSHLWGVQSPGALPMSP